ncbi:winged helix-turn-helix transcriptional regulator [Deinococcus misasensis]|uniref:winged helix-turn-helix transcriptional regulator n=1 Tax=Deinococcus misasensis TaxID=392413 RepID=UPI00054E2CFB|nr:winged helix-turn-helix domain-containing protein [Deinococcus misasensis]
MKTRFVGAELTIRILVYDMQPHKMGPIPERLLNHLSAPPYMVSVTEREALAFKYAPLMDVLLLRHPDVAKLKEVLLVLRKFALVQKILVVTGALEERSALLQAGANEVLSGHTTTRAFTACLQALLHSTETHHKMVRGPMTILYIRRVVILNGLRIPLEEKEMEVLFHLALNPGVLYTRERIMQDLWGEMHPRNQRKVDSVVFMLRRKLGNHFIEGVRGQGYIFRV